MDNLFCDAGNLKRSWTNTVIPDEWMIFYSVLFIIIRTTIDQKQTQCINTTEEIKDLATENEVFENENADNNDDSCNDNNSNMSSDNIRTTKRKHGTQSMEQLNTQFACHFQITYYKLINFRHRTPLHFIMENSIYNKTQSKGIIADLTTVEVTISYKQMKRQRGLLPREYFVMQLIKRNTHNESFL